jgi:hypothetical protein
MDSRNVAALCALLSTMACGETAQAPTTSLAIGMSCVTQDDLSPTMAGYQEHEISIYDRDDGVVCLVDHFQGRVSCPYGQTDEDLALPVDHPNRCITSSGELVTAGVVPQLSGRPPGDAVYTSCHCAGANPDQPYCRCPSGFQCAELIEDLGLGSTEYAGSWCQRRATAFDPSHDYGPECTRSAAPGTPGDCG